jgi:predicted secreted protein
VRVQVDKLLKKQVVTALDSPALISVLAESSRAAQVSERPTAGFSLKMSRGEFMVEASWDGLNEKTIWTIKNSKKSLKKI